MLSFTATITEVLKNNIASPLAVKGSVIITSPSGKVKIGDRVVSALDSAFPPPGVNDSYLLFLKYIPATGAYTTLYKVSFGVSNNQLKKLNQAYIPGGIPETLDNDARYSIANCYH